jgi:hypothetical protein
VSCTWSNAEGSKTTTANVRRDATPPRVTGAAERQPDANGWYNHPIRFQFSGDDGTSGVEELWVVTYTGPDTATARITGSCRDNAGNTGTTAPFEFKYDTTPPKLDNVRAKILERAVVLTWATSTDTSSVVVLRRPALGGSEPSTLFNGSGRSFTDRHLKTGVRYRYTVTAYDAAGNGVTAALVAQLGRSTAKTAARTATTTHAHASRGRSTRGEAPGSGLDHHARSDVLQRPALPQQPEDPQRMATARTLPTAYGLALWRRQPSAYPWPLPLVRLAWLWTGVGESLRQASR